ncbi:MAG: 3TM-type holin [Pseudomonadota bacterium]|nr:3TM-type holin [Pseudomonadota bacterium]
MSWFSKLFAGGAGEVIDKVGNTIDRFHLSGEEKQAFKLELQRALMQRESEIEQTIRKNLEAKERILVAELQQGDTYTKRARPTVVYFGLVMIALNYFVLPALLLVSGNSDKLVNCTTTMVPNAQTVTSCERETLFPLPQEFWVAWGGIVATWAVGRSFEKSAASNRVTRAITGSRKHSSLLDDDEAVG